MNSCWLWVAIRLPGSDSRRFAIKTNTHERHMETCESVLTGINRIGMS